MYFCLFLFLEREAGGRNFKRIERVRWIAAIVIGLQLVVLSGKRCEKGRSDRWFFGGFPFFLQMKVEFSVVAETEETLGQVIHKSAPFFFFFFLIS